MRKLLHRSFGGASVTIGLFVLMVAVIASLVDRIADGQPTVRQSPTTNNSQITLADFASGKPYASHSQEVYRMYLAAKMHAYGAIWIVDDAAFGWQVDNPEASVQDNLATAIGGAERVVRAELSPTLFPDELLSTVVDLGRERTGEWSLHLAGSPPSTLLVKQIDGALRLVDASLSPNWVQAGLQDGPRISPRARGHSPWVQGPLVDACVLILLFGLGGLLLPRDVLALPKRLALALPIGLSTLGTVGLLRVPGAWGLAGAILVAVTGWLWLKSREVAAGWRRADWPSLVVAAGGLILVAFGSRSQGFIWASPDSIGYLAQASNLADGLWPVESVMLKRGLALQQIHSVGFALGVDGIQSLGLAVMVSGTGLLLSVALDIGGNQGQIAKCLIAVAVATGMLVVAAPAVPIQAAYINSHFLVALLLLALVGLLGLSIESARNPILGLLPAMGLLIFSLVLLRPEGTLLASTCLLGTLRANHDGHLALWRWLGFATIAWNGILVWGYLERGEDAPTVVQASLLVGMLLSFVPNAVNRAPRGIVGAVPIVSGIALWAGTLAHTLGDVGNISFLDVSAANIGEGLGRWASFGIMMALLGFAAVACPEREDDGPGLHGARWATICAVPLSLATKLGDGLQSPDRPLSSLLLYGGGVGWGDSVNRMWTHYLFLILLLAIARFGKGRGETLPVSEHQTSVLGTTGR